MPGETPSDTGLGRGRPPDMPTRGTSDRSGQARAADTPRPIRAGDPAEPLPSVLLDPSGIAGWVLRPGDLDRLPVLASDAPAAPQPRPRGRIARALRDDPPNAQLLTDPHRPHPEADSWPDDAVLITYSELRRLIALHLETCGHTMPGAEPWRFVRMRAAAMRDGEVPLLLSEVLE